MFAVTVWTSPTAVTTSPMLGWEKRENRSLEACALICAKLALQAILPVPRPRATGNWYELYSSLVVNWISMDTSCNAPKRTGVAGRLVVLRPYKTPAPNEYCIEILLYVGTITVRGTIQTAWSPRFPSKIFTAPSM